MPDMMQKSSIISYTISHNLSPVYATIYIRGMSMTDQLSWLVSKGPWQQDRQAQAAWQWPAAWALSLPCVRKQRIRTFPSMAGYNNFPLFFFSTNERQTDPDPYVGW